jgi:NAD(P)-dependent dehydrogenase (short-subunit alcohol dehydrogenase family)
MRKINVLLTGGSRGIGLAIKNRFEEEGCNVIAPTRMEMNLMSRESILNYLRGIKEPIDVLINNAGINVIESFSSVSIKTLEETLEVNTVAPFLLSQYCINNYFLKQNKGCIINIGSVWLAKNRIGRATYTLSKVALESITKSIAIEFGDKNITCNMISPGFIGTDLTYKNNTEKELKKIIESVPLKRLGEASEIADLVIFLSLKNNLITGENIYIDGGLSKSF